MKKKSKLKFNSSKSERFKNISKKAKRTYELEIWNGVRSNEIDM